MSRLLYIVLLTIVLHAEQPVATQHVVQSNEVVDTCQYTMRDGSLLFIGIYSAIVLIFVCRLD